MKLIYGRRVLVDLDITDPTDYGIDTFQVENAFSHTPHADIWHDIDEDMDPFWDNDMPFVLSINFPGDRRAGGSGQRNQRIDPDTGDVDRDPWYNNSGHAFYSDWDAIFSAAARRYGSRFKGFRWNHEFQPRVFKEGSRWVDYAEDNNALDYRDVQDSHLTEWRYYLNNIAKTNPRDAYKNEGRARRSPYNSSDYDSVKGLYRDFVDFQVEAQTRMISILADKLGNSHTFIIYPAQRTGHVHTAAEYCINTHQLTAGNIVREIATWDTADYTNAVRDKLAEGQGSRKYFFSIQQGIFTPIDPEDENHIANRSARRPGNVENCLDPGKGRDPWQSSFSAWFEWPTRGTPPSGYRKMTLQEQGVYLGKIRDGLT